MGDERLSTSDFFFALHARLCCTQNKDASALEKMGGVEGLARALKSDTHGGLVGTEHVDRNRTAYGANILPGRESPSFFSMLLDAVKVCCRCQQLLYSLGRRRLRLLACAGPACCACHARTGKRMALHGPVYTAAAAEPAIRSTTVYDQFLSLQCQH